MRRCAIRGAALLLSGLLICCQSSAAPATPTVRTPPAASASPSMVLVLLFDGRLQEVDLASNRVAREVKLPEPTFSYSGHVLAAGPGGVIFALTQHHVYKLAVPTLEVISSAPTPPGTTALAAGPISGNVFLGESTRVVVLEGTSLRPQGDPLSADGKYELAVSSDESRLYAGGHDNGYVQEFDINWPSIKIGRQLRNHGGFVPLRGGGLLTGDSSGVVFVYGSTGDQPRQADTTLGGHMMEYAASDNKAIVLGSCLYLGGLATVDLNSMAVTVVVPKHQPAGAPWAVPDSACGELYFVLGDSVVALRRYQLSVVSVRDGSTTAVLALDGAADLLPLAS